MNTPSTFTFISIFALKVAVIIIFFLLMYNSYKVPNFSSRQGQL